MTHLGHVALVVVLVGEFSVSEWPPRSGKCCLVTARAGKRRSSLRRAHTLAKLCLGVSASAVGWEFNVNESTYPLPKVPSTRSAHQTRLRVAWLMNLRPEGRRDLLPYFLERCRFRAHECSVAGDVTERITNYQGE